MSQLLNLSAATDLASAAIDFYARGDALAQTTADKPLLAWLRGNSETFPSGKGNISEPVQGAFIDDTAGALVGYNEDDLVTFNQAQNILQAAVAWKEVFMGLVITWTELKKDGISIVDDSKGGGTSEHSNVALTRLVGLLKNRMADYSESYARSMNKMLWRDGTQDTKQVPGLQSIFTVNAATGTIEGLSKATYSWWRNRINTAVATNTATSDLIHFLNDEVIQLRRFGGRPDKALCGSDFLKALRRELVAKGYFTQTGFQGKQATELGVGQLSVDGLGTFTYDPTMDELGMSKELWVLDGRRTKLRPMEQEDNKVLSPERPYNAMVFLKGMTWTGGLICTQLNANARYSLA